MKKTVFHWIVVFILIGTLAGAHIAGVFDFVGLIITIVMLIVADRVGYYIKSRLRN